MYKLVYEPCIIYKAIYIQSNLVNPDPGGPKIPCPIEKSGLTMIRINEVRLYISNNFDGKFS